MGALAIFASNLRSEISRRNWTHEYVAERMREIEPKGKKRTADAITKVANEVNGMPFDTIDLICQVFDRPVWFWFMPEGSIITVHLADSRDTPDQPRQTARDKTPTPPTLAEVGGGQSPEVGSQLVKQDLSDLHGHIGSGLSGVRRKARPTSAAQKPPAAANGTAKHRRRRRRVSE